MSIVSQQREKLDLSSVHGVCSWSAPGCWPHGNTARRYHAPRVEKGHPTATSDMKKPLASTNAKGLKIHTGYAQS